MRNYGRKKKTPEESARYSVFAAAKKNEGRAIQPDWRGAKKAEI